MLRAIPYPPLIPDDVWQEISRARHNYSKRSYDIKVSYLKGHSDLKTKMARDAKAKAEYESVLVKHGFDADQEFWGAEGQTGLRHTGWLRQTPQARRKDLSAVYGRL